MDNANEPTMNELLMYVHGAAVIQILRAGVELNIFSLLHEHRELTLDEIDGYIHIDPQSLRTLFMGFRALKLVRTNAEKFSNIRVIEGLFEAQEWEVFKSLVLFQAYIVYPGQVDYLESLIAGQNVGIRRYPGEGHTLYEKFRFDPRTKHVFYLYMNKYSDYANPSVFKYLDFENDRTVLDVGGGGGSNAIALAAKYPHAQVTLLDLAATQQICEEEIRKHQLCERIHFRVCDIFKDPFPRGFDSVLFFHELVIWNPAQITALLSKAYQALNHDGRVIIFNSVSDDSEDGPLMAALDTVYFRSVAAGQGMIYPWKDYEEMLSHAGFRRVTKIRCDTWTPHGIVIGHKE